jgi:hypothetical protein
MICTTMKKWERERRLLVLLWWVTIVPIVWPLEDVKDHSPNCPERILREYYVIFETSLNCINVNQNHLSLHIHAFPFNLLCKRMSPGLPIVSGVPASSPYQARLQLKLVACRLSPYGAQLRASLHTMPDTMVRGLPIL